MIPIPPLARKCNHLQMLSTLKDVDKVTPFIEGVTPHPWQHPLQNIKSRTIEDIMLTKKAVRRVTSAVEVNLHNLSDKRTGYPYPNDEVHMPRQRHLKEQY